jgi:GrpB-like predicted nucleotidyltransferase (UPF0157 family)
MSFGSLKLSYSSSGPLGLARGKVCVVPHDPRWSALYQSAEADLQACLGAWIVAIEHVGSTAVAGLDAKPILDLMIAVRSLRLPSEVFAQLSNLGYEHRDQDSVPGRLFFVKGPEATRTHYLSICESDSPFWTSHLAFRDKLRADKSLAADYARLKHQLAEQFPDDRGAYTTAKESFIHAVMAGGSGH